MTGPNNSSSSGSFIRLYYPADSTADGVNDGEQCRWLPRREYADGLINFMKMPLWLGRFLHWCTGKVPLEVIVPIINSLRDVLYVSDLYI